MDHRSPRSVAACRSLTVMRRASGQATPVDMTSAFLVAPTVVGARFHPACSRQTAPGESAASRARPANASASQLLTVAWRITGRTTEVASLSDTAPTAGLRTLGGAGRSPRRWNRTRRRRRVIVKLTAVWTTAYARLDQF